MSLGILARLERFATSSYGRLGLFRCAQRSFSKGQKRPPPFFETNTVLRKHTLVKYDVKTNTTSGGSTYTKQPQRQ